MSENNFDKTIESPYSNCKAKLNQKAIILIKNQVKKSIQTFYYECIETKNTFTTEVLEDYNLKVVKAAFKKEENKTDIGGMKEKDTLIDYIEIGKAIRKERLLQGISLVDFIETTGLSKRTIIYIEQGKFGKDGSIKTILDALNLVFTYHVAKK